MAVAATVYLGWLGPGGLAGARRSECAAKAAYAAERLCEVPGVELRVPAVAVLQGVRAAATAAGGRGPRRARASAGSSAGVPLPAAEERHAPGGRDRAADASADRRVRGRGEAGARVSQAVGAPVRRQGPPGLGTLKDLSRPGRRAWSLPGARRPALERAGRARPTDPVGAAGGRRARPRVPLHAALAAQLRRRHRLVSARVVLDEVQPEGRRDRRGDARASRACTRSSRTRRSRATLELLWRLERALCEITGMARATLQPPAGACGELTGLLIMRGLPHRARGPATKVRRSRTRRTARTPPACGSPATRRSRCRRRPWSRRRLARSTKLVDEDVAGLMLTNPNTLGLFEEEIERIAEVVHGVGGLVYYDGANLNAILGRCRPGDMGFDIVHINTHKTFATPHGGGGPGAGPVGVGERARPLPARCRCRARRGDRHVPPRDRPAALDRADARVPRQRRRARPRLRLRLPPRRGTGSRRSASARC